MFETAVNNAREVYPEGVEFHDRVMGDAVRRRLEALKKYQPSGAVIGRSTKTNSPLWHTRQFGKWSQEGNEMTKRRRTPMTVEDARELLRWAEKHPRTEIAKLLKEFKRHIFLMGPDRFFAMLDRIPTRRVAADRKEKRGTAQVKK